MNIPHLLVRGVNYILCTICLFISCLFWLFLYFFASSGDAAGLDAAIARAEQATANVRAVFAWEPPEMRRCRDLRFALQVCLGKEIGPRVVGVEFRRKDYARGSVGVCTSTHRE